MAKINIYFEELCDSSKEELRKVLNEEMKEEIEVAIGEHSDNDPEDIRDEVIDNFINVHNFANEFVIE